MKKLLLTFVVLGMFTAVSFAETAAAPVTNSAVAGDATGNTGAKKEKPKHHKGKGHKKAKKEAKADKKADTTEAATPAPATK